jgi:hypothetical protein
MTDEPAKAEPGIVRSLLFRPLDSSEFASALRVAGAEEKAFTREILEHMIERNLSKSAELQERMDELMKLKRFPGSENA